VRLFRKQADSRSAAGAILFASLLVAAVLGTPAAARAAGVLAPCGAASDVLCGTVQVPLDRGGRVPGSIALHVEKVPASGTERGVLFLLAGGPGQAATRAFDLERDAERWQSLFPGYTLVAFDARGTGRSDPLRCQSLGAPGTDFVREMAGCAQAIGSATSFYATRDHAEDVEAVRAALGVRRIALSGTSYGAKLALAYALAHPGNVERLLLDSPLAANEPDVFARTVLRSLPRALRSLCADGFCRKVTRNLTADLAALANALEKKPLKSGSLIVDGEFLLSLSMSADVDGGVRAQLPTAVAEARRGRPGMLLRLGSLSTGAPPDPTFTFPLYVATTCRDGTFPWQPETPLADRELAYRKAVEALPGRPTGPFGRWAAQIGPARFCSFWPPSGSGAPLAAGPAPDVPVLVLSGGHDMRTPTESARAVAGLFRRASVVVVPGVGHSVLGADFSGCAARAVSTWLGGATPASSCSRVRPVLSPVGSLAPPKGGLGRAAGARQTLKAVAATLRSAASAWYAFGGRAAKAGIAGLHGGLLSTAGNNRFSLKRYSDVQGVRLTGQLDVVSAERGALIQLQGTVKVAAARGPGGVLTVSGGRLSGQLGRAPASIRRTA
jgi:pimeloyl-ACP methyl ester carboxylesterase